MTDLSSQCVKLNIPFDLEWNAPLTTYQGLLEKWSSRMNLVSQSDPTDLTVRHFVDSLSLLCLDAVRGTKGRAADLGSGAGFPGLVLAVALPDVQFSLIEPREKRGAFLNQVIGTAGISNAAWVKTRAEDTTLGRFDLVVTRATFPPEKLLTVADQLLTRDGVLAVMAAREPDWDLSGWKVLQVVKMTIGGAPRWIAALRLQQSSSVH
jgi:16S rRNA (guanine527-N7)-methyltransferase